MPYRSFSATIFLSTPSARRATPITRQSHRTGSISIHALCEEGDFDRLAKFPISQNFYPRPLRGGRLDEIAAGIRWHYISIHALCEEGDAVTASSLNARVNFYPRPLRGGRHDKSRRTKRRNQFLSTPSARRATFRSGHGLITVIISIHALCEEGDSERIPRKQAVDDFYPRPLRGGRPLADEQIAAINEFLSTPSARRATYQRKEKSRMSIISIHALCEEGDPPSST